MGFLHLIIRKKTFNPEVRLPNNRRLIIYMRIFAVNILSESARMAGDETAKQSS